MRWFSWVRTDDDNAHSLHPSPTVDQYYLDYGPQLDAMRGKKWVLAPHCVETTTPGVKVNLFEVPDGYVLPVTIAKRWRAPQGVKSAWLEEELASPALIGAFELDEPEVTPRSNQNFTLAAWIGGEWVAIAEGKTNGLGKNSRITQVTARKFRLTMGREKGSPGVADLHLYRAE